MFQLANGIMKFMAAESQSTFWTKWVKGKDGKELSDAELSYLNSNYSWVETIYSVITTVLVPILAIVAAAGIIWAIVLGVQMARADSTEKREEAKKRLIGLVVGIAILVVLIIFFTTLFPVILKSLISIKFPDSVYETTAG